jgi:fructokinase
VILVAGEALIDLVANGHTAISATPGGGPFNAARTAARLGIATQFFGAISGDRFGRTLHDLLIADGVDVGVAPATDLPTTLAVAEIDARGAATYRFYIDGTSAPRLLASDIDGSSLAAAAAVHAGTLGLVLEPMASTVEELVLSSPADAVVLIDPNCRPATIPDRAAYLRRLHRVLQRADVVKVSTDDLAYLDPERSPLAAARNLAVSSNTVVLVTDGPRDVHCLGPAWEMSVAAPHVVVADTIGAGDAFGAAFLAGWVHAGLARHELHERDTVADLTTLACQVAAITCERVGADPPRAADVPGWPPLRGH